jgi:trigger factor
LRFKEEIKSEVLQEVVPLAVTAAIEEHDLHPLSEPYLHLEDRETLTVNGSRPISLKVHVEVMPDIPDPKFEGIEVTRRVKPVLDGEIEDLIAGRLQKEAALIPVEGRPSEIGDTVIADLEGRFDDQPDAEPIRADDLEVLLGDEVIERSFTENLVGVLEDDEKEFTVTYPAEFSSEALAGKTIHYKAKIKSVGKTEVPDLNDEWAEALDEGYESLADLRAKLRSDLEAYAEADADARLRNNAIAKLIEDNSFEVPNSLIENQARNLLNNFARDMQERGVDLRNVQDEFLTMAYGNMRAQAERDVRGAMLLERVAEMEKISVSDAEIEAEITRLGNYYGAPPAEIRETIEKQNGGIENIHNNLKTRKAIEAVVAKAKVTTGDWVDENAAAGVEADDVEPNDKVKKTGPGKRTAEKA